MANPEFKWENDDVPNHDRKQTDGDDTIEVTYNKRIGDCELRIIQMKDTHQRFLILEHDNGGVALQPLDDNVRRQNPQTNYDYSPDDAFERF